jgi:hypothetical protein
MAAPGFGGETGGGDALAPGISVSHSPLGPLEDRRIELRYQTLCRCASAGWLIREGKLPADRGELLFAEFHRRFICLGDHVRECFERVMSCEDPGLPVLVRLAVEPEVAFGLSHAASEPDRECPVCGLPTPDAGRVIDLSAAVAAEIRLDLPAWQPALGLCSSCAATYTSLVERRAATRMPAFPQPGPPTLKR